MKDDEPRSPGLLPNKNGVPQLPVGRRGMMMTLNSGRLRLSGRSVPLSELVNMLGNQSGRPIIDKTGLTSKYDFDLEFAPEGTMGWMVPLPLPQGGQPGPATGPNPTATKPIPLPRWSPRCRNSSG